MKLKGLRIFIDNISWQFGERLFLMTLSFGVNVLIARYLGAFKLGELQYVNALLSFFIIFTYLGLNDILIKELVLENYDVEKLLGTTFSIKIVGSIIAFISFLGLIFFLHDSISTEFKLALIIAPTLFLRPFDVIISFFDSKVMAKYYAVPNMVSVFIGSILKFLIVYLSLSIYYLGGVIFLVPFISTLLLTYFFLINYKFDRTKYKFDFSLVKMLLSKSWWLILSAAFSIIYLKIDQVMIRNMQSPEELGVYSVAVGMSEIWYFIPSIIITTVFPKFIELRKGNIGTYNKTLQLGYDLLFLISFSIAIIMSFLSSYIIDFLYGAEFSESSNILLIHIWSGIFIFIRSLLSRWLIMEDLMKYTLITQGAGAIINIALNLVLIPSYGGIGAAVASLISYAVASYFVLFLSDKTRVQAVMISKSFLSPFRIKKILSVFT